MKNNLYERIEKWIKKKDSKEKDVIFFLRVKENIDLRKV